MDVRLLFWRPDDETAHHRRTAFWGAPEHIAQLEALGAPMAVRWDRPHAGYCQHQTTWLIDPGDEDPLAFHRIAAENRERLAAGVGAWQGLAFALDASTYGRRSQLR